MNASAKKVGPAMIFDRLWAEYSGMGGWNGLEHARVLFPILKPPHTHYRHYFIESPRKKANVYFPSQEVSLER